jgi:hypothetical protein
MGNRFPSRTQSGPISRPAARAGIRCTEIYATLQMAGTPRFPVELTRRYRLTLKGGTWTVCDSGTAKTSHLHGSKGPEENRSEGPGSSAAFGPQLSCHRGIIHKRHKSTETQKAQKCGTPRASVAGLAALFELTLFGSFVCQWAGHRLRTESSLMGESHGLRQPSRSAAGMGSGDRTVGSATDLRTAEAPVRRDPGPLRSRDNLVRPNQRRVLEKRKPTRARIASTAITPTQMPA